ncbi:FYVE-domain-containing protein [Aspergillus campestris IBT 28561]|uniref:RING-type E3 ubiquitin transferase n=1 Tax=Aspergillus campestris (strain IBT 28561) TaxID=1392248 RepID=A0A2I1CSA8_ASPC2|nr:FYVE-domain-containing protein [Aspergillus campestris IBT 28561]PKY00520.1 FYVE-domain-containing protein [Aspergillus campestris IBT 28561]
MSSSSAPESPAAFATLESLPESSPDSPALGRADHAGSGQGPSRAEPGPAYNTRPERRRSTLSGSDRKRRLVDMERDGRHPWPGASREAERESRSIPRVQSQARPDGAAGASYADPIDLSSSPPPQQPPPPPPRPANHPTPWGQNTGQYGELMRPRWQPDAEATNCPICGTLFSFWYRKHHCRKCGRVVCASCSPHRITIPRQFIVHPPEAARSRASSLMTPRVPVIDLEADTQSQSPSAVNPALGGGEEVRLCNPCVPDPNPDPPRGYPVREPPPGGWGPRHRSYHSVSSGRPPYDAIPDSYTRPSRRTVGSNDYPGFMGFGSSSGTPFAERMDYGSQARPLPFLPGSARSLPVRSSIDSEAPVRTGERRRPPVAERDLCPICVRPLPALGANGGEDAREAHIRDCIASHGRGGSPEGPPTTAPVRMVAYTATEKDCLGEEGVAECTICMEEYAEGEVLVRLECLCKFHQRCIVEWFERKKECPVHK